MPPSIPPPRSPKRALPPPGAGFSELETWASVGDGWQRLHGNFSDRGYSIEWHDFQSDREFDWSASFHPQSLEICLNLSGHGTVGAGSNRLELAPLSAGFYLQSDPPLSGVRAAGERHQFITIELAFPFLTQHLDPREKGLSPWLRDFQKRGAAAQVSRSVRLTSEHQQMIMSLRQPPVCAAAHRLWYHAKALEVAAAFFYQPVEGDEFFCQRQKRQNQERAQKVIAILKENLAESLSLEEIGRRVGCSHFHLSRIFVQEMGKPIFQHLRLLRLERAAQLLSEGSLNVTQVALEVGYSSLSHFSTAFHEAFGCCPGLYPMATSTQRSARNPQP